MNLDSVKPLSIQRPSTKIRTTISHSKSNINRLYLVSYLRKGERNHVGEITSPSTYLITSDNLYPGLPIFSIIKAQYLNSSNNENPTLEYAE
jgi:hypothetical protein